MVEAGRTDNAVNRTWGEVNGKGQNMLGVLLMEVRDQIKAQEAMVPKARAKKAKQVRNPPTRDAVRAAA
ncbi:MAG TPA: hypothetical protein VK753_02070 [Xanthomonadaceae bacterium]|jgi:hypothetical protein|nr:hypothetical protein [Xanthomonadaceae bacterium]